MSRSQFDEICLSIHSKPCILSTSRDKKPMKQKKSPAELAAQDGVLMRTVKEQEAVITKSLTPLPLQASY